MPCFLVVEVVWVVFNPGLNLALYADFVLLDKSALSARHFFGLAYFGILGLRGFSEPPPVDLSAQFNQKSHNDLH